MFSARIRQHSAKVMCEPQGIVQEGQLSLKGKQSALCLYLYLLSYIMLFVFSMLCIWYNIM